MSRRNPWLGALWSIAAVLIVGALAAQFWVASFYYQESVTGPGTEVINVLQQLADTLVMPAFIVGFATVAGLLFLHARNHAKNHAKNLPRNHASKVSREGTQREGTHAPY